jgi:hypothetical protein
MKKKDLEVCWTGRWSRPSLADRNIIVHLFYYQTYKVVIINRRRVVNSNGLSTFLKKQININN